MKEKKNSSVGKDKRFEPQDLIKGLIWDILVAVFVFAWVLLMLLIISFVTSGFLHFRIEKMIAASIICGVLALIFRFIMTIRKYRKQ